MEAEPEVGDPGERLAARLDDPRRLYLELLKQTLTRVVAPDETIRARMPDGVEPGEAGVVEKFLARHDLVLARHRPFDLDVRSVGRDWPFRGETMVGLARLDNLEQCLVSVLDDGVPGDVVETGVWRGGATIFMRAVLAAWGDEERCVWVADSFEGLPPPRPDLYPADEGDQFHTYTPLAVSREKVEANFAKYGLL
ncbi:MAG TPA: TylF/MycF/NovP-related O-methyltransferase, partial [Acidimicrobiia bacterium]|nr:TylF/MycF/NovP-related O-methyltransferase [Acidimicrobiia bacterium]